jgi:hypothetical protein
MIKFAHKKKDVLDRKFTVKNILLTSYFAFPILANGTVNESLSPHSNDEFHVSTPGVSNAASSCGSVFNADTSP